MLAVAYELETFLHGYMVPFGVADALILILSDGPPELRQRAEQLLEAAQTVGMTTGAIGIEPARELPTVTLFSLPQRPADVTQALLMTGLAGQLLTLELAEMRRVNPDLLRREEETYAQAAQLARGFPSWASARR